MKGTIHLCFETFYLLRADENKTGVADGDGYADQITENKVLKGRTSLVLKPFTWSKQYNI